MMKDLRHPFKCPNYYLFLFLLCIPALVVIFIFAHDPSPALKPWLDGFTGNLIAGIIQAVMFLFLAFYLDGKTEQKIDEIEKVTKNSKDVLDRNERITREKELIYEFEKFLHRLSHYDVRFPDLRPRADHLGLEYTIEPVRDPSTNLPRKYETDSENLWIVKVRGPSQIEVRTPETLTEFSESPIKEDTYYFCRFVSGSWYMGEGTILQPYRFYMSGYVGRTEYGISANYHMSDFDNPVSEMTVVAELYLDLDGNPSGATTTSVDQYKILKDADSNIFLTINSSLPRGVYFTNPPNTYDDTGWYFLIEKMIGFASGEKLIRIQTSVRGKLDELSISIPKVPWHQTQTHRYEPPI